MRAPKCVAMSVARAVALVAVLSVLSTGCYDPYGCSDDSECFAGEQCRSGFCVSARGGGDGDGARASRADTAFASRAPTRTPESGKSDGLADAGTPPCEPSSGEVDAIYGDFGDLTASIADGPSSGTRRVVVLCGGTTAIDHSLHLSASHVEIRIREGAVHTIDASEYRPDDPDRDAALEIEAEDIEIDGTPGRLILEHSGGYGLEVRGSSDVALRGITARRNHRAGFRIGAETDQVQLEYCASYENTGPTVGRGGTAAGGAVGFEVGATPDRPRSDWPSAIGFRRCLAHHNVDDGFDLTRSTVVSVTESISYANGADSGDGEAGTGFTVSRGRERFYEPHSGHEPPDTQSLRNVLAWRNRSAGILVGSGRSIAVSLVRAWNNGLRGGENDADISFQEPVGPTINRAVVTSIESADFVFLSKVRVRDLSKLEFERAVDAEGNPKDPSTFAQRAGEWVEATLTQEP